MPEDYAGRSANCPTCGRKIHVPAGAVSQEEGPPEDLNEPSTNVIRVEGRAYQVRPKFEGLLVAATVVLALSPVAMVLTGLYYQTYTPWGAAGLCGTTVALFGLLLLLAAHHSIRVKPGLADLRFEFCFLRQDLIFPVFGKRQDLCLDQEGLKPISIGLCRFRVEAESPPRFLIEYVRIGVQATGYVVRRYSGTVLGDGGYSVVRYPVPLIQFLEISDLAVKFGLVVVNMRQLLFDDLPIKLDTLFRISRKNPEPNKQFKYVACQ